LLVLTLGLLLLTGRYSWDGLIVTPTQSPTASAVLAVAASVAVVVVGVILLIAAVVAVAAAVSTSAIIAIVKTVTVASRVPAWAQRTHGHKGYMFAKGTWAQRTQECKMDTWGQKTHGLKDT
jgi:hypothetical protein